MLKSNRPILFIFLGDNGTSAEVYADSIYNKSGFYRAKASVYEGGIRVPSMMWASGTDKGRLTPRRRTELVHLVDLFPTITALAGVPHDSLYPPGAVIDGVRISVFDQKNSSSRKRQTIFFERGGTASAFGEADIHGYKLILRETGNKPGYIDDNPIVEIYDTSVDPYVLDNLAKVGCKLDKNRIDLLFNFNSGEVQFRAESFTTFRRKILQGPAP